MVGERLTRRAGEVEAGPPVDVVAHLGQDLARPQVVEPADGGDDLLLRGLADRLELLGGARRHDHRLVVVAVDRAHLDALDRGAVAARPVCEALPEGAPEHRGLHGRDRVREVHVVLLPEQLGVAGLRPGDREPGRSRDGVRREGLRGHAASWARVVIGRH